MEAFIERQSFFKRWPAISLPVAVASFIPMISGSKQVPVLVAIMTPIIIAAFSILLFSLLVLHTRIDDKLIKVRFAPFQAEGRIIAWTDIKRAALIKYDPLYEYGGWGFKKGWTRKKIAYNVSGKTGLELQLNDGRSILIGTSKEEELGSYLTYLKSKYSINVISDPGNE